METVKNAADYVSDKVQSTLLSLRPSLTSASPCLDLAHGSPRQHATTV